VADDLGVRKAIGAAYGNGNLPSETDVRELTAHGGLPLESLSNSSCMR